MVLSCLRGALAAPGTPRAELAALGLLPRYMRVLDRVRLDAGVGIPHNHGMSTSGRRPVLQTWPNRPLQVMGRRLHGTKILLTRVVCRRTATFSRRAGHSR